MSTDLGSILNDQPEAEPAAEVVEQPTPEAQAEQTEVVTGEEVAAPPAEQQEDPIEKRQKGLEAAVTAERRRRQELERQLAEFQQAQQATKPQAVEEPQGEPQRQDFADDSQYFRALAKYEAKQIVAAERQEQTRARERQEQEAHMREFQKKSDETVNAGRAKFADFDAVINDGLAPFLNPVLQEALIHAGGHEVAYWLGKNPAEAARVSQLPPMQMVLEIGRLESKVAAAEQQAKPLIPKTLTQERNVAGQFVKADTYNGPTPLDAILANKRK